MCTKYGKSLLVITYGVKATVAEESKNFLLILSAHSSKDNVKTVLDPE